MSPVHATARLCRASPADALALLTQPEGLARWNLGLERTREVAPGLLTGESRFDGSTAWVRVQDDAAHGHVEYTVGAQPDALAPRIQARVQPGAELGYAEQTCVVTLLAWRTAEMDDARWSRLQATHEVEIELIRAQLEHRAPRGDPA
jgi:uncharacterized protein YndB with AHSA1/START domain